MKIRMLIAMSAAAALGACSQMGMGHYDQSYDYGYDYTGYETAGYTTPADCGYVQAPAPCAPVQTQWDGQHNWQSWEAPRSRYGSDVECCELRAAPQVVYVQVPVEVEKVVEKRVEVPVEKIVEKIVEVEKPVYIEKPTHYPTPEKPWTPTKPKRK